MDYKLDSDFKQIGLRIIKYRKMRHLKQSELAENVEVSLAQIQKIEQGRGLPRLKTLLKITSVLEVQPGNILNDASHEVDELVMSLLDKYHHLSDDGKLTLLAIAGELFKLESNIKGGSYEKK